MAPTSLSLQPAGGECLPLSANCSHREKVSGQQMHHSKQDMFVRCFIDSLDAWLLSLSLSLLSLPMIWWWFQVLNFCTVLDMKEGVRECRWTKRAQERGWARERGKKWISEMRVQREREREKVYIVRKKREWEKEIARCISKQFSASGSHK